jgi:hypothetical protein
MEEIKKDLQELIRKIEGKVDGLSFGEENSGVSKVSIKELEEIQSDIETIFNRYFRE